jgi:uncharacterized tellurite resistance protein B-like protein
MTFISRLRDLLHDAIEPEPEAPDREARLTVAALLVLVAKADGRVLKVEEDGLKALLRSRFGLSPEAVERVLLHVEEIEAHSDPASTLAERILHDLALEERPRLLAMAYRVAALDGQVHEFEDDLVWRIGRLSGLTDEAIADIREGALRNLIAPGAVRA